MESLIPDVTDPELPIDPYESHKKGAASRFWERSIKFFPKTNDNLTSIVYHYTTLEGFKSIVENSTLWASNFSYLNDSSEIWYGKNLLNQLIKEEGYLESNQYTNETKEITNIFLNFLNGSAYHAYGCCFSSLNDSLSQWRGYGQGIAIGFDRWALDRQNIDDFRLEKVNYSLSESKSLVHEIFHAFLTEALQWVGNPDYNNIKLALASSFCNYIEFTIPMMKDPSFSDEMEWRLVKFRSTLTPCDQSPEIKFRAKGNLIIPYLELKLSPGGKLPINHVKVGPTDRMQSHLLASVSMLLAKHGYGDVGVSASTIPFRP